MTAYSNITYQTNISSINDLSSILGGAENPGYQYSSNNVLNLSKSQEVYLNKLEIVNDSFIKNYLNTSQINFNNMYYIDIIFNEPTLIHGSIIVGFNMITEYMDITDDTVDMLYPEIKLQYNDNELNDLIDLYNGNIISQNEYKNSIESALKANRDLYLVKNSVNEFIDVAISNKTLDMPTMENTGVYFDKEKNINTYLNPIGIFNQVIIDPVNGETNSSNFAVVDVNPSIGDSTLDSIYSSNLENITNSVISNRVVLVPEPMLVKKLRLLIRCPYSFVCNISAFYVDDIVYTPSIYETESGSVDMIEQVNIDQNPLSLAQDSKIVISNGEMKMFSAKFVWEGQLYSNIDDNLLYVLSTANSDSNLDLSQAYIRGKNFEVSSKDTWFIDGENLLLESLKDSYCDFGSDEQNIKIMYVHNIGISNSLIANNTISEISFGIDVYNINNIQSDFIKTIKFKKKITQLNSYTQSLNYPSVQSLDSLSDGVAKLSISSLLGQYAYPGSGDIKITIDTGKDGSIESNRILYSIQTVKFDPDMARIFDITLDIPKYTDQSSLLELIPTTNFCQIGLDSNDFFDKDNFKILFGSQDSVNTFEDKASFFLVFMAKGIRSFKDTIIVHIITTIISES